MLPPQPSAPRLPQDTKLADTRTLLAEEQIVAGITELEAGFLFLNADTNEAQVQGSEKRKGVAKHHFLHTCAMERPL